MRRRDFIEFLGGLATARPFAAFAQQAQLPRIGMLSPGRGESDSTLTMLNAFVQGLHELGYTEGQNIVIERQYAEWSSDRLHALAADLIGRKVDAVVAVSTTAARAAR